MLPVIAIIGGVLIVKGIINSLNEEETIPQRRIFISHSWRKSSEEYQKFVKKLYSEEIDFFNHSIPKEKAFDTTRKKELEGIFRKKMVYCSKVYVLAKRGIKKDSYVGVEIKIAKELGKEIIAVKPHGQVGMPQFIKRNANRIISNNIQSITRTLKQ